MPLFYFPSGYSPDIAPILVIDRHTYCARKGYWTVLNDRNGISARKSLKRRGNYRTAFLMR